MEPTTVPHINFMPIADLSESVVLMKPVEIDTWRQGELGSCVLWREDIEYWETVPDADRGDCLSAFLRLAAEDSQTEQGVRAVEKFVRRFGPLGTQYRPVEKSPTFDRLLADTPSETNIRNRFNGWYLEDSWVYIGYAKHAHALYRAACWLHESREDRKQLRIPTEGNDSFNFNRPKIVSMAKASEFREKWQDGRFQETHGPLEDWWFFWHDERRLRCWTEITQWPIDLERPPFDTQTGEQDRKYLRELEQDRVDRRHEFLLKTPLELEGLIQGRLDAVWFSQIELTPFPLIQTGQCKMRLRYRQELWHQRRRIAGYLGQFDEKLNDVVLTRSPLFVTIALQLYNAISRAGKAGVCSFCQTPFTRTSGWTPKHSPDMKTICESKECQRAANTENQRKRRARRKDRPRASEG